MFVPPDKAGFTLPVRLLIKKVNSIHLLTVWRRPGRQTQGRNLGRGITRLARSAATESGGNPRWSALRAPGAVAP